MRHRCVPGRPSSSTATITAPRITAASPDDHEGAEPRRDLGPPTPDARPQQRHPGGDGREPSPRRPWVPATRRRGRRSRPPAPARWRRGAAPSDRSDPRPRRTRPRPGAARAPTTRRRRSPRRPVPPATPQSTKARAMVIAARASAVGRRRGRTNRVSAADATVTPSRIAARPVGPSRVHATAANVIAAMTSRSAPSQSRTSRTRSGRHSGRDGAVSELNWIERALVGRRTDAEEQLVALLDERVELVLELGSFGSDLVDAGDDDPELRGVGTVLSGHATARAHRCVGDGGEAARAPELEPRTAVIAHAVPASCTDRGPMGSTRPDPPRLRAHRITPRGGGGPFPARRRDRRRVGGPPARSAPRPRRAPRGSRGQAPWGVPPPRWCRRGGG